jgi:hypothetical protein
VGSSSAVTTRSAEAARACGPRSPPDRCAEPGARVGSLATLRSCSDAHDGRGGGTVPAAARRTPLRSLPWGAASSSCRSSTKPGLSGYPRSSRSDVTRRASGLSSGEGSGSGLAVVLPLRRTLLPSPAEAGVVTTPATGKAPARLTPLLLLWPLGWRKHIEARALVASSVGVPGWLPLLLHVLTLQKPGRGQDVNSALGAPLSQLLASSPSWPAASQPRLCLLLHGRQHSAPAAAGIVMAPPLLLLLLLLLPPAPSLAAVAAVAAAAAAKDKTVPLLASSLPSCVWRGLNWCMGTRSASLVGSGSTSLPCCTVSMCTVLLVSVWEHAGPATLVDMHVKHC